MIKKIILICLFIGLFINKSSAKARIPVCIPCEKIALVKSLPFGSSDYKGNDGEKLDIGYKYNEYGVVMVPLWNGSGNYVLTNKKRDTYYDITKEELAELSKTHQLDISASPLSFWQKFGGKLAFLGLIAVLYFIKMVRK